jgi:hypothetical protein
VQMLPKGLQNLPMALNAQTTLDSVVLLDPIAVHLSLEVDVALRLIRYVGLMGNVIRFRIGMCDLDRLNDLEMWD